MLPFLSKAAQSASNPGSPFPSVGGDAKAHNKNRAAATTRKPPEKKPKSHLQRVRKCVSTRGTGRLRRKNTLALESGGKRGRADLPSTRGCRLASENTKRGKTSFGTQTHPRLCSIFQRTPPAPGPGLRQQTHMHTQPLLPPPPPLLLLLAGARLPRRSPLTAEGERVRREEEKLRSAPGGSEAAKRAGK